MDLKLLKNRKGSNQDWCSWTLGSTNSISKVVETKVVKTKVVE